MAGLYLYWYPCYRAEDDVIWPCKVGMSERNALARALRQSATATPEMPVVGLLVLTDGKHAHELERKVHGVLHDRGQAVDTSRGCEWFRTSPDDLASIIVLLKTELAKVNILKPPFSSAETKTIDIDPVNSSDIESHLMKLFGRTSPGGIQIPANPYFGLIRGTPDAPLFQANQIAKLLGIVNVRENLKNFDEVEVCLGRTNNNRTATFLTENGLNRLLAKSRKPIARYFQRWIANSLKEIQEAT
jgi:prophage antirepressor-like protein